MNQKVNEPSFWKEFVRTSVGLFVGIMLGVLGNTLFVSSNYIRKSDYFISHNKLEVSIETTQKQLNELALNVNKFIGQTQERMDSNTDRINNLEKEK